MKMQFTMKIPSNTQAPKTGITVVFEYIKNLMRTRMLTIFL